MSRVNVDIIAFADSRFAHLAILLGLADHDHARSKVEYLWWECTFRGTPELPVWVIEAKLGAGAAGALVEAELGSYTTGRGDSKTRLVRISGAEERCLWMVKKQGQTSKAGKARASGASRAGGKFTSTKDSAGGSAGEVAPAETSPPTPTPTPTPEREQTPDSAGPKPPPSKPPEDPPTHHVEQSARVQQNVTPKQLRVALAHRAWQVALAEHVRLKLALNSPAQAWPAQPGTNFPPFEELVARIAEIAPSDQFDAAEVESRLRNRIAVAAAEAEVKRSLDFFTPHWLWKREQFARADGETPEQVRRRAAARPAEAAPIRFTFGAED